jgi:hypothetical protein
MGEVLRSLFDFTRMNKKKLIKTIALAVGIPTAIFLWAANDFLNYPFERIQRVEDNDELLERYFSFYEKFWGEDGLNDLLRGLVTVNESYTSLCDVAAYIEKRGKCEFLPYLDAKCMFYDSMPKDTVLRFTIRKSSLFQRYNDISVNSHFIYGPDICTVAATLRKKCEAQYGSPDLFPTLPTRYVDDTRFKEYIRRTLISDSLGTP